MHKEYAILYVHSFQLRAPRKQLDAYRFMARYYCYEEIPNVPDRLRWLRHTHGLMQKEIARIVGIHFRTYSDLETGATRRIPPSVADALATYYQIPVTDLQSMEISNM